MCLRRMRSLIYDTHTSPSQDERKEAGPQETPTRADQEGRPLKWVHNVS